MFLLFLRFLLLYCIIPSSRSQFCCQTYFLAGTTSALRPFCLSSNTLNIVLVNSRRFQVNFLAHFLQQRNKFIHYSIYIAQTLICLCQGTRVSDPRRVIVKDGKWPLSEVGLSDASAVLKSLKDFVTAQSARTDTHNLFKTIFKNTKLHDLTG